MCIQGDSRGRVNTVGGDSIRHTENKSSYSHVSNCLMVTEIELFECTNAKTL